MEKLETLMKRIDKFNKDRDWDQFHSPENLAKSISIEAGELLECFQWDTAGYEEEEVEEELADVMNYCLQMCLVLKADPVSVINKKMDKTEKKYPVAKAKGVSTKYDKLK
jgi:dCTP diphosphatase